MSHGVIPSLTPRVLKLYGFVFLHNDRIFLTAANRQVWVWKIWLGTEPNPCWREREGFRGMRGGGGWDYLTRHHAQFP